MTLQLSETEEKMLDLLRSGNPVSREQLKLQTRDGTLCSNDNLRVHISNLRKKLQEQRTNLLIFSKYDPKLKSQSYQMVSRINNPYDGRT